MKARNTIGMDMGDKNHEICILNSSGDVIARKTVGNTIQSIEGFFGKIEPSLVAMEAGTHSSWVSHKVEELGHDVLVGNPRKLRVIWDSNEKNDQRDAEMLARIARLDKELLYPIHHRSMESQADLALIKARNALVKMRSKLVSFSRGIVKSSGHRITKCGTPVFNKRLNEEMPDELRPALGSIAETLELLNKQIRHYDICIEELCQEKYPITKILTQIAGVGPVTALDFVLTLEDSSRFKKSRDVGSYLGLVPKRDQSGMCDKQLGITKAGDEYLRSLLVGCAQYILGVFGPDCDLRTFGLKLAERGGKNAKRRAVVAVSRKLAVLMHHLWKSGEDYDPHYKVNSKQKNKSVSKQKKVA